MSDFPKDRAEFEAFAIRQSEVSPSELAGATTEGSVLFRLIGKLLRDERENASRLTYVDLISDEGRLQAIKQQGTVQGRAALLESIIDLIIEGAANG